MSESFKIEVGKTYFITITIVNWVKFITQKENYIDMNSIVAGIVSQPQHYRLSSASDESPIKVIPLR